MPTKHPRACEEPRIRLPPFARLLACLCAWGSRGFPLLPRTLCQNTLHPAEHPSSKLCVLMARPERHDPEDRKNGSLTSGPQPLKTERKVATHDSALSHEVSSSTAIATLLVRHTCDGKVAASLRPNSAQIVEVDSSTVAPWWMTQSAAKAISPDGSLPTDLDLTTPFTQRSQLLFATSLPPCKC